MPRDDEFDTVSRAIVGYIDDAGQRFGLPEDIGYPHPVMRTEATTDEGIAGPALHGQPANQGRAGDQDRNGEPGPATPLPRVVWAGRVRRDFQPRVRQVGEWSCRASHRHYSGSMLASCVTTAYEFLDGGVIERRGFFDATCGMFLVGRLARAHVLYQLGLDARRLLRDPTLPTDLALQTMVRLDRFPPTAEQM